MIRIAFIGSDSTHTEAFGNQINHPYGPFHTMARVVSIWGENPDETCRKARQLKIDKVASTIDEALENVDFAMVIGRFAESHFEPTLRALERKIPTFVDKPLTLDLEQARELSRLAKERLVPLCSSSPLRFDKDVLKVKEQNTGFRTLSVAAPANCVDLGSDKRLDNVFFYGIHAVEMLLEILGSDIGAIKAYAGRTLVSAHVEYKKGTATVSLVRDTAEFYRMEMFGTDSREAFTVNLDGSYYFKLLRFLLHDFYTGKNTISLESTIQAITILESMDKEDQKWRRELS